MDYALLCAGSLFTVGVTEEECDTASLTKMADAPEGMHKMAEATTHHQFPESHNMPAKPGSALIVPVKPGSVFVVAAKPESPARMATTPADAPLWPGLIASVLDPPLVSVRAAGIPRSAALSAPSQELAESAPEAAPSQELAESAPEARSVPGARRVRSRGRSVRRRGRSVSGAHRFWLSRAPAGPVRLSRAPAGPVRLSRAPAGPVQLTLVSAGPAQLTFVYAGPTQLTFVSAGPAQLTFSAGSVQFSAFRDSAPPERPLEVVVFPKEIVLGGATCLPTHGVSRSARAARVP